MKILFPYMARWHAVNWTRYHSLLSALADAGHVVHVLQPPPLQSAETNFQEIARVDRPNVHVHDVPLAPALWNARLPFDKLVKKAYFSYAAYGAARRLVEREGIDVLLLYNIPQYRLMSLPVPAIVFDYADDYIDMLGHELGRFDFAPVRRLAEKILHRMMQRATVTTAVSHVLAAQARGNVRVLPNGVSLAKARAAAARGSPGVASEGKPVVGFIGSFEYFIDLDLMYEVARAMPEVHFLFVGTGRDWAGFKRRIEAAGLRNVQLTGGVPHEEVFAYIGAMDICLNLFRRIPVSHRACPIKLFEYLSQKKPVVSTRLEELAYIDRGFLYYGDTPGEVVSQIRAILADPQEAARRAAIGYERTVSAYTWDRIAAEFAELVPRAQSARQAA